MKDIEGMSFLRLAVISISTLSLLLVLGLSCYPI